MARTESNTPTKVARPPADPNTIPSELRAVPQWVVWGFVDKGEPKLAKVPFIPGTRYGCRYTDPASWRTCDAVMAEALQRNDVGIGFVLSDDDNFNAVDLDNAFDDDGQLRPWAAEIVSNIKTFAERSPSGTGLHLIGRGTAIVGKVKCEIATGGERPQAVERYSQSRYLTVTGDVFAGDELRDIRGGMAWLAQRWFPESARAAKAIADSTRRSDDPDLDREIARVCLEKLRPERSADADDWRRVGYALKACGDDLSDAWHAFSKRWPNYSKEECTDRWARFRPTEAGVQTLIGMAADDAGLTFRQIIDEAKRRLGRNMTPSQKKPPPATAMQPTSADDCCGGTDLSREATCTDKGLSLRMAKMIRGRLAYVRERQMWVAFNGKRWLERSDHIAVQECMRLHGEMWRELGELDASERTPGVVRFVQGTGSKKTIDAVLGLAKNLPGINVSQSEFDAHPWLLNVENGVIDLRSGELQSHNPALRITQLAPVTYDPDARSDLWEQFIREVTCADDEIANFLQQAFGLALTGDVSDEVLICHNGGGCNGKSTALEAVAAMLGDYAAVAPPGLFTARNVDSHPTEIAALYGKRFVTAIEQEANRALRESLVKSLTGGDTIRTRRMREDFWEMKPTWKIHIAYNRAPRLTGTDDGIRRRLRVVPWAASFKDRPDPTVKLRLTGESERAGILAWCVEGLRRRLALGRLESPAAVLVATDEYIDDEDLIGRFIADRCVEGPLQQAEIRSTLAAFKAWMVEDGAPRHVIDGYTANALGRELARRGYGKCRPDTGVFRKRVVYKGLSVSPSVEYAQSGEEWSNPFPG